MGRTGTREWSDHSENVCVGCSNNCRYCYAKANAIRFKRRRPDNWSTEIIVGKLKKYAKRKGRTMLPTTHDITDGTEVAVLDAVNGLLLAGNSILIVSKPRLSTIRFICENLNPGCDPMGLVTFRFTIGSYRDSILKYWEPGAPCFADRLATLVWCHNAGWETSISCEPMLDSRERMVELVEMMAPFVSDSIWIGKMNQIRQRLTANGETYDKELLRRIDEIECNQADGQINLLYDSLKDHPLVKWKDSIKKVVGLPEEEPG